MLAELFKDMIINKKIYISANDGEKFEEKIKSHFKKKYDIIFKDDIYDLEGTTIKKAESIWKALKEKIIDKNSLEVVKNPFKNITNSLIYQPYGSQNFPDFLLILKEHVISVEVKFTTNENKKLDKLNKDTLKPMWNSNLPKANAIYIYGVAGEDVTFFKGADVLPQKTREVLLGFWKRLDEGDLGEIFLKEMKELDNPFGFYPYIRKAYDQKLKAATYRYSTETGVIKIGFESYFSANAQQREINVINFLKDLK